MGRGALTGSSPVAQAIAAWPVDHLAVTVVSASTPGQAPAIVDHSGPQDLAFPLASVTKLLTATAMLVAVEEETVALDDQAGPPGSTIAHLLAHASGLGPDGGILAPPGRRRIYSNTGFDQLSDALGAAAGMAFVDYLTEAVLEPLGMTATHVEGSPAHGGHSTASDLACFAQELLLPRVLDATTVAAATKVAFKGLDGVLPGFGPQHPNDWGLGFEIRGHKTPHWTGGANSPATFGHFGRTGTFLWVDPDAGAACICLSDRTFGPWAAKAWPKLSDTVLKVFATNSAE